MLTFNQLQSIMPRLTAARSSELLPFLTAAMSEFAIEAPARAAAFLAQLAHESGQFRFMEEIWGPTDAQKRYEPVTRLSQDLGNIDAGDGKLFKGRGPIQLTGRANYKRFGDLLGVDLIADRAPPPRNVGFRVAGLFWSKRGPNEPLTPPATTRSCRMKRINGGTNGLPERRALYAVARNVLGVPDAGARAVRPDAARSKTISIAAPATVAAGQALVSSGGKKRKTVKKKRAKPSLSKRCGQALFPDKKMVVTTSVESAEDRWRPCRRRHRRWNATRSRRAYQEGPCMPPGATGGVGVEILSRRRGCCFLVTASQRCRPGLAAPRAFHGKKFQV
jgi:putative chitinase